MPYDKKAMSELSKGFHASTTEYDPIAKGLSSVGDKIKGLFSDSSESSMGEALARRKSALSGMKKDYE